MSGEAVRLTTVKVMLQLKSGGSLTRLLPDAQQQLPEGDRALLQVFCFGMARWSNQLEGIVTGLLSKPLKAKDNDVFLLMQLGVFQLQHTRVAPHAAVNSTVAVVKKLGKPWAKGLVNAVLRNFQRQSDSLIESLDESASFSHPEWLLTHFKTDWPESWRQIVEQGNTQAPMILRVNHQRNSTSEYLEKLEGAEIVAQALPLIDSAVVLSAPVPVGALPGFSDGDVSVQDGAAQLAADLMVAGLNKSGSEKVNSETEATGLRLLDACAAPGGKTAHAIEKGVWQEVIALDNDATRLERVEETLQRLNISGQCSLACADASDVSSWWDGKLFDAILIDAPCSGTGVIRRHPDIKLLRRKEDIHSLVETQRKIMSALWHVLAPGGIFIYATCSVLKAENERQLDWFLSTYSDAKECAADFPIGQVRSTGSVQILPGDGGLDGFYYAVLSKAHATDSKQTEPGDNSA